jgi:hypothetical protein
MFPIFTLILIFSVIFCAAGLLNYVRVKQCSGIDYIRVGHMKNVGAKISD